jgi:hypothetical protein
MARVRDVEIHEVPEDVQPVYERFSREYGPFLNKKKNRCQVSTFDITD